MNKGKNLKIEKNNTKFMNKKIIAVGLGVFLVVLIVLLLLLWPRSYNQIQQTQYKGIVIHTSDGNEGGIYLILPSKNIKKLVDEKGKEKHGLIVGKNLYFSANYDGDFDIYVMDLTTGKKKKLTDMEGDEIMPTVNQEQTLMAFAYKSDVGYVVVIQDLNTGKEITQLGDYMKTNFPGKFIDNNILVLTLQDYNNQYTQEVWLYNIKTKQANIIIKNPDRQDAFPYVEGNKIVFTSMNVYGGNPYIEVRSYPSLSLIKTIDEQNEQEVQPLLKDNQVIYSIKDQCKILSYDLNNDKKEILFSQKGECYTDSIAS